MLTRATQGVPSGLRERVQRISKFPKAIENHPKLQPNSIRIKSHLENWTTTKNTLIKEISPAVVIWLTISSVIQMHWSFWMKWRKNVRTIGLKTLGDYMPMWIRWHMCYGEFQLRMLNRSFDIPTWVHKATVAPGLREEETPECVWWLFVVNQTIEVDDVSLLC